MGGTEGTGNAEGATVVEALEAPELIEGDPGSTVGRHQVVVPRTSCHPRARRLCLTDSGQSVAFLKNSGAKTSGKRKQLL